MHKPLNPGEIVKDALFEGTSLTVTEAAQRLKVDRTTLSRLLNGHAGISADMACRLAKLLGTTPEMWLNVQRDYDLWQAYQRMKKVNIRRLPVTKLRTA